MTHPVSRILRTPCCCLALALALALAACERTDPYVRAGDWRPLGANAANLRAMLADPADLYRGRAAALSSGDLAAAAVARLRTDAVKRLPPSSIAEIHETDTAAPQNPGNAATPAAPVAAPAASGAAP